MLHIRPSTTHDPSACSPARCPAAPRGSVTVALAPQEQRPTSAGREPGLAHTDDLLGRHITSPRSHTWADGSEGAHPSASIAVCMTCPDRRRQKSNYNYVHPPRPWPCHYLHRGVCPPAWLAAHLLPPGSRQSPGSRPSLVPTPWLPRDTPSFGHGIAEAVAFMHRLSLVNHVQS